MFSRFKNLSTAISAVIFSYVILSLEAYAEPRVGVIIPELRAPFNVIFETVGMGVDDRLNKKSSKLLLKKGYDPQSINRWIEKEKIRAVITLGGVGRKASVHVPKNIPIVLGALLSSPGPANKLPGVALTPNPKSLFNLLKRLDNKRKKIVVVYNPKKNQWLVDLAKRQAAAKGVRLVAYEAIDIKQSAIIYDKVFDGSELDETAIWLLQDRKIVDSKVVLPFILEKAWQKKIVVFSSALSHVKKGVLFSMYPDNKLHGKQLAELMLKASSNSASSLNNGLYPTEGLQDAINSRTAEHLGLSVSRSELREFDVVFPLSN
ncbi:MAG: ABC transporter substrate binding protein [Gammaproteobacteria bacterium]|nr:ABC transporter substrate binding protein [Gammaproteobacteria bacterium]